VKGTLNRDRDFSTKKDVSKQHRLGGVGTTTLEHIQIGRRPTSHDRLEQKKGEEGERGGNLREPGTLLSRLSGVKQHVATVSGGRTSCFVMEERP